MSIEVMCPGGEALTGTFSLDTSSGALLSDPSAKRNAKVENVLSGKTIYIAIAPGTKNGFMAVWYDGESVKMKDKMSAVTFEAGKIYDLGNTSAWN